TLLETVLHCLRSSKVDDIVVVLGAAAETIQHEVPLHDFRTVINERYQQGMSTSLAAGIAAVRDEQHGALIVLADQPFVQPDTINLLIDRFRESRPQAVAPVYRGSRGNPVLVDRSLFPEVRTLQGDVGCRAIFASKAQLLEVSVDDIGVLLDLDTQADLERVRNGALPVGAHPELHDSSFEQRRDRSKTGIGHDRAGGG
ncbi:MAG: nucleotidyltransferase family protein, partial [Acidobacteriaceae bacterium]|nr:nucleotidyltransferase family protein [Acidobacteriaceae bacterium]